MRVPVAAVLLSASAFAPGWADEAPDSTKGIVETPRRAFVTSAQGPPILGDWPEATAKLSGLEAADSICQNLAETAGLDNPEKFIAWLSDSSDDAYCRVHNLDGKRENNCGQKVLPASAGPWMRTDGQPWASSIDEMLGPSGVVYTPLNRTETGAVVGTFDGAYTATSHFGALNGSSCSDWQDTPDDFVRIGAVYVTTQSWTGFGSSNCQTANLMRHLYCLETEPGLGLSLPQPQGRLAFVTSVYNDGLLGGWVDADPGSEGIAAGDSICNNLAQTAGLPDVGYYKAWLSDASTDASARFESDGPWYRPDGFQVAGNLADLTDGILPVPVNVDENANYWGNSGVWTGTLVNGSGAGTTCDSWGDTAAQGMGGRANNTTLSWTASGAIACDATNRHLYCFSDRPPGLLREDGFEDR